MYEVDYRVYAHLAIMTYEVEVARQSAYDFSMVQDYCEKAKEMAAGREGVSDSCMGTVEVLLERIK